MGKPGKACAGDTAGASWLQGRRCLLGERKGKGERSVEKPGGRRLGHGRPKGYRSAAEEVGQVGKDEGRQGGREGRRQAETRTQAIGQEGTEIRQTPPSRQMKGTERSTLSTPQGSTALTSSRNWAEPSSCSAGTRGLSPHTGHPTGARPHGRAAPLGELAAA